MKKGLSSLFIAGVDEAGRGPLAGPVTAAAVVLPPSPALPGLADSKKLTEKSRDRLYEEISRLAIASSVVCLGPREIERLNIREATKQAMEQAAREVLQQLQSLVSPSNCFFLVDGNMPLNNAFAHEAIVKADQLLRCVSAASILAKVTRDRLMLELDRKFPGYGLASHKGYPTKLHRERIRELGPTEVHRRTFAGVREHL